VKKKKVKKNLKEVEDFYEKMKAYQQLFTANQVLPAFLSVGNFTEEAKQFCQVQKIGMAVEITPSHVN